MTQYSFYNVLSDWTHAETLLLLESFKSNRSMLTSSTTTTSDVYEQIASELKSHGVVVEWDVCGKKINNMKYRYLQLSQFIQ